MPPLVRPMVVVRCCTRCRNRLHHVVRVRRKGRTPRALSAACAARCQRFSCSPQAGAVWSSCATAGRYIGVPLEGPGLHGGLQWIRAQRTRSHAAASHPASPALRFGPRAHVISTRLLARRRAGRAGQRRRGRRNRRRLDQRDLHTTRRCTFTDRLGGWRRFSSAIGNVRCPGRAARVDGDRGVGADVRTRAAA